MTSQTAPAGPRLPFRINKGAPAADPITAAVGARHRELPRLFTPAEVADQLGIGRRTLDRWRLTGEGPAFVKLSAQTVRYTAEAVAHFIEERQRASTAG